jgi:hypothetical protein
MPSASSGSIAKLVEEFMQLQSVVIVRQGNKSSLQSESTSSYVTPLPDRDNIYRCVNVIFVHNRFSVTTQTLCGINAKCVND